MAPRACPNRGNGCRCEPCKAQRDYQRAWAKANYDPAKAKARRPTKDAAAAYKRARRAKNPERSRKQARKHYAARRAHYVEYAARWRAEHPDKVRAIVERYRAAHPFHAQAWADRNPDAYIAKRARDASCLKSKRGKYATARLEAAGGTPGPRLRSDRRAPAGSDGACWICLLPMLWRHGERRLRPSRDHILPVSLGGLHAPDNLAWAHRSCNSARGNHRMPSDQSWAAFVEHRKARIGALIASCASRVGAG